MLAVRVPVESTRLCFVHVCFGTDFIAAFRVATESSYFPENRYATPRLLSAIIII